MGKRLVPTQNPPELERLRLAITAFVLVMIPLLIVGAFIAGAGYGVVAPLAGLLTGPAVKVVSYYFR